ncbi:hypothetical protein FN846DRAFT_775130 [Sphaerosporella brunnea]|uniref:rRNA-processing protein FYV7 n=1 Tax=Sphaerosporella brunnea TaxID=1250544 RepID=A0A5J5F472_9PEZI|nr:hypothetical protein FN846DRAFT_775130 [Sphaerosporella brunnea]
MARERPDAQSKPTDKKKLGFSVGPANLPDGTYKRKVTKIKERLIHKAKVKKQYRKTLASAPAEKERLERRKKAAEAVENSGGDEAEAESSAVHPDRQAAMDTEPSPPAAVKTGRRERRPKTSTFKKEESIAARKKREREEAARLAEERRKEREKRIAEREMAKKTMSAKTKTGQLKLGKQSHVLLKKVMEQLGKN